MVSWLATFSNKLIYRSILTCLAVACASSCELQTNASTTPDTTSPPHYQKWADVRLDSLDDISIEALRARQYESIIRIETQLGGGDDDSAYQQHFSSDGSAVYKSFMASYHSDGQRIYTRIDVPASAPTVNGYPVMVLVHGWVGIDDAPGFDFGYKADSLYSRYIDAFVDAGYMVLTPGWRGHGTVDNKAADGIEFMQSWDNGSYISPVFYAIDVLNLVDGLQSIQSIDWKSLGFETGATPRADTQKIHLAGHSQGGDSALTVLAVSGENSSLKNKVTSASIWSGCFATRFDQALMYGPMATTLEAFMSGDGNWTGSSKGQDGSENPNFVFAWPPDWIGTVDIHSPEWSWQKDNWKLASVAESLQIKFSEMYDAVNRNVADINDARFEIEINEAGKAVVRHDPRIVDAMNRISAFNYAQYLTEPVSFHHSDQDYYSVPDWNSGLSDRINAIGGNSRDFTYAGNTHSLLISKHEWFSPKGTTEGFEAMLLHDLNLAETTGNQPTND